jgi:hypothetical protein
VFARRSPTPAIAAGRCIGLPLQGEKSKSQAPNPKQIPNRNIQALKKRPAAWDFEFGFLGFVWYLGFVYCDFCSRLLF